jgi:hypothetical protein
MSWEENIPLVLGLNGMEMLTVTWGPKKKAIWREAEQNWEKVGFCNIFEPPEQI